MKKVPQLSSNANAAFLEQVNNDENVKKTLKDNTQEALASGAFGAPTMIVKKLDGSNKKPEMFFGSDRFDHIAAYLNVPFLGNNPQPSKL